MAKRRPGDRALSALRVHAGGRLWMVLAVLMNLAIPATLAFVLFAGSAATAQEPGVLQGKVADPSGEPVYGALVTVEDAQGSRHMTVTDAEGMFRVSLAPGEYAVKVSASGFSDWTASKVSVEVESRLLLAVLQVAPQVTTVTVGLPPDEVAQEQLTQEVKQRTLKVLPNYYVSYEAHPAPLSPKQKLHLATKLLFDPTTFVAMGTYAGIQQGNDSYRKWGLGAEGYGKRLGAAYTSAVQNLFVTGVFLDSVLHQDPRYHYSGNGTKWQRAAYAIESAFRTKGDNGKWQPPYAGFLGAIASSEISETYYPGSRTQRTVVGRALAFHFGGLVVVNLFQEFALRGLTSHRPVAEYPSGAVLRAGTPVKLIAADGLSTQETEKGQTVTFVLAEDVAVDGKVLARTGDVATGLVGQVRRPQGETMSVTLGQAMLRAGNMSVPLRSSQVRGATGPVQCTELPESGKVELTLFVAEDVPFPDAH